MLSNGNCFLRNPPSFSIPKAGTKGFSYNSKAQAILNTSVNSDSSGVSAGHAMPEQAPRQDDDYGQRNGTNIDLAGTLLL